MSDLDAFNQAIMDAYVNTSAAKYDPHQLVNALIDDPRFRSHCIEKWMDQVGYADGESYVRMANKNSYAMLYTLKEEES